MNGLLAAAGQGESSRRRVTTTNFPLDTDLHEAELAWARLRAQVPKGSLITAVDYYLAHAGHVIELHYLRDKLKREVDFLVSRDGEPWFLVEVKQTDRSLSSSLAHFQGARIARRFPDAVARLDAAAKTMQDLPSLRHYSALFS